MEQEQKTKAKRIEAIAILIAIILAVIYFYPRVTAFQQKRQNERVVANCKLLVKKTLECAKQEQAGSKAKLDLDKISQELKKESNVTYCDAKAPLCCMVEYDKKTNTIIVTGFDSSQEILTRTVITPPSFVTYER